MAIIAHFEPRNMTADKYAEVMRRLQEKGLAAPKGRIHHASYGPAEQLRVVDIWDGPESFGAFGEQLMPLLASLGIDTGPPSVAPVHNVVRG